MGIALLHDRARSPSFGQPQRDGRAILLVEIQKRNLVGIAKREPHARPLDAERGALARGKAYERGAGVRAGPPREDLRSVERVLDARAGDADECAQLLVAPLAVSVPVRRPHEARSDGVAEDSRLQL